MTFAVNRRTFVGITGATALGLAMAGCGGSSGKDGEDLSLYTSAPKDQYEPAVADFETESGISVEVVSAGTGELINRIQAEGDNPLGDVQWGGLGQAVAQGIDSFAEYVTENDSDILEDYRGSVTDSRMTPFSIVLNAFMVNDDLVGGQTLDSWESLLSPDLKGKIAFADPAKSSSALSQVMNMLHAMGDGNPENGWDYVEEFVANLDGKILGSSSNVYQMVADGEYGIGITNETNAVKYLDTGGISIAYPSEGNLVLPDNVLLINNAKNPTSGKQFIDFVTSKEYQSTMETVGLRTVRTDVEQDAFPTLDTIPIVEQDDEWVEANGVGVRDRFLDLFTG